MANQEPRAAGRAHGDPQQAKTLTEHTHDPSRVLALSDGVFAIILTLLVLDLHLPQLTKGQSLGAALRQVRPSLVAFVISFVLAGMYWVGHRDLFGLVRRTDRGLVWLNLLYLLPLCLLPYGALLLGRFDREPVALRLYGLLSASRCCAAAGGGTGSTRTSPELSWSAVAGCGRVGGPGDRPTAAGGSILGAGTAAMVAAACDRLPRP